MDAEKLRKLEDFTMLLKKHGANQESQGHYSEAIKDYVKLVDILLLLAREAKDHSAWQRYTSEAEAFQKRAKSVIITQNHSHTTTSRIQNPEVQQKSQTAQLTTAQSVPIELPIPPPSESGSQMEIQESIQEDLAEENEWLKLKIKEMIAKSEYEAVKSKVEELSKQLEDSVPLSEFRVVEEKLADSVSASEYEELKLEHKKLQNLISTMVPKEEYESVRDRLANLESQVQNSIPRTVLDNLAKEVSFLALTAALPAEVSPNLNISETNFLLRSSYFEEKVEKGGLYGMLRDLKERLDILELRSRGDYGQTLTQKRREL